MSPPRLITLICLAGLTTLTLNMFVPSLPAIARDLDADPALVTLSISGYLAATAVVLMGIGPLADRIGRRPVVLGALLVFCVASAVCALAQSVTVFLAARLVQSVVTAGYAMSLTITRDTTEPRAATGRLGTIAMFMGLAPMLGPMIGGGLEATLGWRASFWLYAGAGAALWLWCWVDLGETRPSADAAPREAPWSLLSDPAFWAFALCTAFSTGAFYIFIATVPLVAEASLGMSAAQVGIGLGTITAGYIAGSAIAGRFGPRVAITRLMRIGRYTAVTGPTLGLLALIWLEAGPALLFGATLFVGLGNGLTLPASNSGTLSVRPELAGTAAGASGAITVMVGAALTAAAGHWIADTPTAQAALLWILLASAAGLAAALIASGLSKGHAGG